MNLTINFYGQQVSLTPRIELYSVDDYMGGTMPGLAIVLDEADTLEQFAVLTVSFGELIGVKNCAYIDINNCGEFYEQLLQSNIARDTGFTKESGFCKYPLWQFNEDFLKQCNGQENYQKYSDAIDEYMSEFSSDDEPCP